MIPNISPDVLLTFIATQAEIVNGGLFVSSLPQTFLPSTLHLKMHHLTSQNLKRSNHRPWHVGLPLAIDFSKHYDVIGYDINQNRIHGLTNGTDECLEVRLATF